jgi:hypothetical protein
MHARQQSFFAATADNVYFGVGSYGNDQTRAGLCYRITASGVDRDLIVQVVNQGGDVPDGNFDLQVADGGYGVFDACVAEGTSVPQFDGSGAQWGALYGGWSDITGCDQLPAHPHCGGDPQDDLQDLCRWSFQHNMRLSVGNSNPSILNMCQVKCPAELYEATGLRRSDEANTAYTCGPTGNSGGGLMTRMMDCTKPSYGWTGNVKGQTYPGYELVVPCRRDGYTRINALPTAPTTTPTAPSRAPSATPSAPSPAPSVESTAAPLEPTATPSRPTVASTTAPTAPSATPSRSPSAAPSVPLTPSPTARNPGNGSSANPFVRTPTFYVNPSYQAELSTSIATATGQVKATLESMLSVSSAYWIDVKGKLSGSDTSTVEGILNDAANKPTKQLVTLIVYDLPNRDCHVSSPFPSRF